MNSYYAGIDGGGTGTLIECAALDGRILLRGKAGPLNFNGSTPETIRATIFDAVRQMEMLPGGMDACLGLCIACAGSSSRANREMTERFLDEAGSRAPRMLVGDHQSALMGALEGAPGIALISGTGSICLGKNAQGQTHRCGGWGHLMDDGGSAYAMGRDILSAVVQAEDGRMPSTLLTGLVYEKLGVATLQELIGILYGPGTTKAEIAALAPLGLQARAKGDDAAIAIHVRAAQALFSLVETTARELSLTEVPLALCGSVLQKNPVIRDLITRRAEQSPWQLRPCQPAGDGAHGALLMAKLLGLPQ